MQSSARVAVKCWLFFDVPGVETEAEAQTKAQQMTGQYVDQALAVNIEGLGLSSVYVADPTDFECEVEDWYDEDEAQARLEDA